MSPQLRSIPTDVAVLCPECRKPVPLVLFLSAHGSKRQVTCAHCRRDIVIPDAW